MVHSLVYQTLYFKLRGMKEFSNGPMDERRRGKKEFSNGLTPMVQQEYMTADGLTGESLIAKADMPEPSKFVKRRQLNYCT